MDNEDVFRHLFDGCILHIFRKILIICTLVNFLFSKCKPMHEGETQPKISFIQEIRYLVDISVYHGPFCEAEGHQAAIKLKLQQIYNGPIRAKQVDRSFSVNG